MDSDLENGNAVAPPKRVMSFWEAQRPLSEQEKIARWMGAQLADDWQVHHEEVVKHIETTYGPGTDHLSSTDSGGASIDDHILDIFEEPFKVLEVDWKGHSDYSKRRWELYKPGTPLSEMDLDDER